MANTSEGFQHSASLVSYYIACFQKENVGIFVCIIIRSLCILVGAPAHVWCLRLEWKVKQTQMFCLHHTVIELIYCTQCFMEMLNVFLIGSDGLLRGIFFFLSLSWSGRPMMQICVCVEQYLAVLHPVTFLRAKQKKYRIGAAANVWFLAIAYGVYKIFHLDFPDPLIDGIFLIAVLVISFCCVSVLCALKNPGPADRRDKKQSRDAGNKQKRKAFNIIFRSLLIILFTYLPQTFLSIFEVLKLERKLLDCNIVPLFISSNNASVLIVPLLKIYKERHKKSKNR